MPAAHRDPVDGAGPTSVRTPVEAVGGQGRRDPLDSSCHQSVGWDVAVTGGPVGGEAGQLWAKV